MVRPSADPPAAPADTVWTVSQLASKLGAAIGDALPGRMRVCGEVSGFRERTHWYFQLKDADASLDCVIFASAAKRAGFTPENGRQVVLGGRVEFYARQGRASFVADRIEPVGAGAGELAFRKLCEELRGLGWFDESRKRPVPAFPAKVCVVTSRTGAALQDVLDTMRRRCPAVGVALIDVRVQGEHAASEVAAAVRWAGGAHRRLGISAVLVTRGGGSAEDLAAFNAREVAEAIVNCPVPVVAAIGHETDTTIAELVADARAATPTQAAMRLTPDRAALHEQIDACAARLAGSLARLARLERERLRGASRHPLFRDPRWLIERARGRADTATGALGESVRTVCDGHRRRLAAAESGLERSRPEAVLARSAGAFERARGALVRAGRSLVTRERLDALARHLDAVGPASVLRRGFSLTLRADGRVVRSVSDVRPGDALVTRLEDGSVESVVAESGSTARSAVQPPGPPRRVRRAPEAPQDDGGLFGPDHEAAGTGGGA